jgi:hypothetical protein
MTKSSAPKVLAKKAGDTHRKTAARAAPEKARPTHRKTARKVVAENERDLRRKTAPEVVAEKARHIHRKTADQFDEFRDSLVPDSMRALADRSVAQTREVYERSKNALQAVLESWEKSFGAAGQGAVALNRKIIDIAERNVRNGFDLATSLAGTRNLAEVMELQAAYWRKQFGELRTQAEEERVLSTKVTANVTEPIKAQVTRVTDESKRRIKSS